MGVKKAGKTQYNLGKNIYIITEIMLMSRLRESPNVVKFFGWTGHLYEPALLMERIEREVKPKDLLDLPFYIIKQIAVGAATGLSSIHGNRIIHSDFSLRNVFVDHEYVAKVGDFGHAKEADQHGIAVTPYPLGSTCLYAGLLLATDNGAPEVFTDESFSFKSDVYSFGYFLLQLLYGQNALINTYNGFEGLKRAKLDDIEFNEKVIPAVANYMSMEEPGPRLKYLIRACMYPDAERRPDMSQVVSILGATNDSEFNVNTSDVYHDFLTREANNMKKTKDDADKFFSRWFSFKPEWDQSDREEYRRKWGPDALKGLANCHKDKDDDSPPEEVINDGHHGKILSGKYGGKHVAKKIVKKAGKTQYNLGKNIYIITEIMLMSRLRESPNVVKFFGWTGHLYEPALLMERIEREVKPKDLLDLPFYIIKQIAIGAATGLSSIHGNRIIHSDFSLRNVF